jgi:hypothetical protein
MPWQWDYENYYFGNEDMIGFFYPEDINTMIQIKQMENKREAQEQREMENKK